ncbi:hypothetical protein CTAYLR_006357 [Chrysophaeum taylorii]|uniref:Fe2OG dioxygenase domain-containing protein n=1 Tax=Chrysophaeum taylorii TaxID=2483200 RepID=A0AAD7XH43_9STRA|nr:hypothetical protein CTAYLR_006357 [Chrysophaeum taylorii]
MMMLGMLSLASSMRVPLGSVRGGSMPVDERELGMWLLAGDRTSLEVSEGARALLGCDEPLALCMASWALASHGGSPQEFTEVAASLAPRIGEVAALARGPEALVSTARAFASVDVVAETLFDAIGRAARGARERFDADQFALLSRCFAVARSRGAVVDPPFGEDAPRETAWKAKLKVPGVERLERFVSTEEIEEILGLVEEWRPSLVHGEASARTSETASLASGRRVVDEVSARAAAVFGLDRSHCESLQLVRYRDDRHFYEAHWDLLEDPDQLALGGQRLGTVLVYLTTVAEGGETTFPDLDLSFRPTQGDALAWCNVTPQGDPDLRTRHSAAALPRSPGRDKVAINCWIRAFPGADQL